jgi:hypothetical protein
MEVANFSETSANIYETTRLHIQENGCLHIRSHKNVETYMELGLFINLLKHVPSNSHYNMQLG